MKAPDRQTILYREGMVLLKQSETLKRRADRKFAAAYRAGWRDDANIGVDSQLTRSTRYQGG